MPSKFEKEIEEILNAADRRSPEPLERRSDWQKRDRERWKKRPQRRWPAGLTLHNPSALVFGGVGLVVVAFAIQSYFAPLAMALAVLGIALFVSPIFLSFRRTARNSSAQYWRGRPVGRSGFSRGGSTWGDWWRGVQRSLSKLFGKGPGR